MLDIDEDMDIDVDVDTDRHRHMTFPITGGPLSTESGFP